jgi:hypothetical protein
MQAEAVGGETLVSELATLVEQRRRDKYALQVGLARVEFVLDKEAASALELGPEMSAIERDERYLRAGVLRPVQFTESDGTRHQVLEWDPAPVAYSGFMGCVTHSIVVTDRGTFEVGRYAAMDIQTLSKVWQWFIHRQIEGTESDRDRG